MEIEEIERNKSKKYRRVGYEEKRPTLTTRTQKRHTLKGSTLLWGSIGRHWPLPHDMVPLIDLANHAHWVLLSLVVLSPTTGRHVILL